MDLLFSLLFMLFSIFLILSGVVLFFGENMLARIGGWLGQCVNEFKKAARGD